MPDLLVVGRIHTLDPARPLAEALLVRGGRIACVGTEAECSRRADRDATLIRAGSAVPGLVDAHGHVEWLGRGRLEVGCAGASEADCVARVAERARTTPRGRWIRGRGWDENRWPGARLPGGAALSRAAPEHPVALSRVDGHAVWVNAAALGAAGIDPATPDPPGGRIVRDARGAGAVLVDAAQDLVLRAIPEATAAEIEEALAAGLRELASLGLTAVHDAGVRPAALDVYRRLAAEDRLPVRVYAMIDGEVPVGALEAEMARWRATPEVGWLEVRSVKLYADGALGSRGAALFEDYADEPGNRGLIVTPPEALRAKVAAIARAGLQPAVHAIGDRGVAVALDALEATGDLRGLRPRIEHLQIVLPREVARAARAGVVASMQPTHATGDGPWVAARLGAGAPRLRGAYAWRTVLRAGIPLAFGSDFPVESADPRLGLFAAETRLPEGSTDAFLPEERLSRGEAVRAFTSGAAHAAFAEARRGAVREGLDADLTLFADDVMAVPASALPRVPVTHAIVGGRIAWSSS